MKRIVKALLLVTGLVGLSAEVLAYNTNEDVQDPKGRAVLFDIKHVRLGSLNSSERLAVSLEEYFGIRSVTPDAAKKFAQSCDVRIFESGGGGFIAINGGQMSSQSIADLTKLCKDAGWELMITPLAPAPVGTGS